MRPARAAEVRGTLPLKWVALILATTFTAAMAVVILRAEAARVNYELSRLDQRARVLQQELREKELELARLDSPAVIRAKLAELRLQQVSGQARTPSTPPPNP